MFSEWWEFNGNYNCFLNVGNVKWFLFWKIFWYVRNVFMFSFFELWYIKRIKVGFERVDKKYGFYGVIVRKYCVILDYCVCENVCCFLVYNDVFWVLF